MIVQTAASNTLIQAMVPDELRGRVMATYSMMFMGMAPFGALIAGLVAARLGAPAAVAAGGMACIAGAVAFGSRLPAPPRRRQTIADQPGDGRRRTDGRAACARRRARPPAAETNPPLVVRQCAACAPSRICAEATRRVRQGSIGTSHFPFRRDLPGLVVSEFSGIPCLLDGDRYRALEPGIFPISVLTVALAP